MNLEKGSKQLFDFYARYIICENFFFHMDGYVELSDVDKKILSQFEQIMYDLK